MNNINTERDKIINNKLYYIKDLEKDGIDTSLSSVCYTPSFAGTSGLLHLKNRSYKFSSRSFFLQIKRFIYLSRFNSFEVFGDFSKENINKYKKIVVSCANEKDFFSNWEYFDKYFQTSSKNKKIIWFLIYIGNKRPKKIKKNIILLYHPIKNNFNLILLFKYLFKISRQKSFNIRKIYHELSFESFLANFVKDFFKRNLYLKNFKKIIFAYESQPFQNSLINLIKEKNKKITTIGYDHGSNPFPIHINYNLNSPDLLYVHSQAQKKFYTKYFKWPKKKVRSIPSFRTNKAKITEFKNKIFFPSFIYNENNIAQDFENFLNYYPYMTIKPLKVRIHPAHKNSKKHLKLKDKIDFILKIHRKKFSNFSKKSLSIHIFRVPFRAF